MSSSFSNPNPFSWNEEDGSCLLCLIWFFFVPVKQEKVKAVFDNLIQLEHLNIVKFHKYWADVKENRARVRGGTHWHKFLPGS